MPSTATLRRGLWLFIALAFIINFFSVVRWPHPGAPVAAILQLRNFGTVAPNISGSAALIKPIGLPMLTERVPAVLVEPHPEVQDDFSSSRFCAFYEGTFCLRCAAFETSTSLTSAALLYPSNPPQSVNGLTHCRYFGPFRRA